MEKEIRPMRGKERRDKKRLVHLNITVSSQTAWHLQALANSCKHKDIGRVVDKLVRSYQLSRRISDD